jgi:hypothetical protein
MRVQAGGLPRRTGTAKAHHYFTSDDSHGVPSPTANSNERAVENAFNDGRVRRAPALEEELHTGSKTVFELFTGQLAGGFGLCICVQGREAIGNTCFQRLHVLFYSLLSKSTANRGCGLLACD